MAKEKSENKTKAKELSRREFLKDAGLIVGGAALGSIALAGACTTNTTTEQVTTTVTLPPVTKQAETTTSPQSTVTNTTTTTVTSPLDVGATIPPSQGYLVLDSAKCAGCQVCMLTCSLVHEGVQNPALSRIQVLQNTYKPWPDCVTVKQCHQCPFPACVSVCPTGACHVDTANGNVRTIDQKKCTGCERCLQACPYEPSGIVWDFTKLKATKCDLCIDAPYFGQTGGPNGKQACVLNCPQQALKFTNQTPNQVGYPGYEVNLR